MHVSRLGPLHGFERALLAELDTQMFAPSNAGFSWSNSHLECPQLASSPLAAPLHGYLRYMRPSKGTARGAVPGRRKGCGKDTTTRVIRLHLKWRDMDSSGYILNGLTRGRATASHQLPRTMRSRRSCRRCWSRRRRSRRETSPDMAMLY